jgi:hypothetical protein
MSDPRTLSMMEYEDWRTPEQIALSAAIKHITQQLYGLGLKDILPGQGTLSQHRIEQVNLGRFTWS